MEYKIEKEKPPEGPKPKKTKKHDMTLEEFYAAERERERQKSISKLPPPTSFSHTTVAPRLAREIVYRLTNGEIEGIHISDDEIRGLHAYILELKNQDFDLRLPEGFGEAEIKDWLVHYRAHVAENTPEVRKKE